MAGRLGTRQARTFRKERIDQGSNTRFLTRDVGMTKNVTASITFTAVDGKATGAASTFTNFAAGDDVLIEGCLLNNGFFTVTSTDASTFLVLDPPPKNEGPLSVTIRTP